MESNKQEKYDLMHDNPVAKDASGGRDGSWMSKHSQSRMGSPLHEQKWSGNKGDYLRHDVDGVMKKRGIVGGGDYGKGGHYKAYES